MATQSSVLPWRIPRTEEAGGPQSMGSQSWTQLKRHCTHVPTRQPRDPTWKSRWCRQKKMTERHRGTHTWASPQPRLPHLWPFGLIPRKASLFPFPPLFSSPSFTRTNTRTQDDLQNFQRTRLASPPGDAGSKHQLLMWSAAQPGGQGWRGSSERSAGGCALGRRLTLSTPLASGTFKSGAKSPCEGN